MDELRIIKKGNNFHGYQDGRRWGFSSPSVVDIFIHFYGAANHTERHTFENIETHIKEGMCLWLFGNEEWWLARIGRCEFIETDNQNASGPPDPHMRFSRLKAISFSDYAVGASRVNWTDAISRITYDYEESVWWRSIHNDGTDE